jgi:hypothetical protein
LLGARNYDPDVGRFLSKDPFQGSMSSPQSLNRYTYCLNNPVKYIDPWGLLEKKFAMEGGDGGYEEDAGEDGEGSKDPTLNTIDTLIEMGLYLYAVLLVLVIQGYDESITDVKSHANGGGIIKLILDDTNVTVHVGGTDSTMPDAKGKTVPTVEGGTIHVHIYDHAFFLNDEPCAEKLWHTVGHEMVHAQHMVKGGPWWIWLKRWKKSPDKVESASEIYAYQWNISNYNEVQYEGGLCDFLCKIQYYYVGLVE